MEKKRSIGVNIAGLFEIAVGTALLFCGLYLAIGDLANSYSFGGFGISLGALFSLIAIFIIILGIFVLKLKPWARTVSLVLSGLFLFNNCFMLLLLSTGKRIPMIWLFIEGVIIATLIASIVFFTRPKVKEQFK